VGRDLAAAGGHHVDGPPRTERCAPAEAVPLPSSWANTAALAPPPIVTSMRVAASVARASHVRRRPRRSLAGGPNGGLAHIGEATCASVTDIRDPLASHLTHAGQGDAAATTAR
jgi:hypothetical protein